jgi:hypothetical protein
MLLSTNMMNIDWTDEEYRSGIEMLPISGPGKKRENFRVTRRPFPNFRPVIRISTIRKTSDSMIIAGRESGLSGEVCAIRLAHVRVTEN